jgi:hypothetical protein
VTETSEAVETSAPSALPNDVVDNFVGAGTALLVDQINQANALAQKLENVKNSSKRVFEIRDDESTEDKTVQAYQRWAEKWNNTYLEKQAQIEQYIRENLMPDSAEPVDEEAVTAQYKALTGQVKAMTDTITSLTGSVPSNLPELKVIAGVRRQGTSSQGIRRPRFASVEVKPAGADTYESVTVDKKDDTGKVIGHTANLTALANWFNSKHKGAGITSPMLQKPIFEAAGTEDVSTKSGQEITFAYTVADKVYEIRVIPTGGE